VHLSLVLSFDVNRSFEQSVHVGYFLPLLSTCLIYWNQRFTQYKFIKRKTVPLQAWSGP